jgi:ubiquitin-protein ligase E3 A
VIYKKLKGEAVNLQDLAELQPDLASGLEQLLVFSGDVQSAFQFNFQISYESLGEIRTIDLKENGGEIPVTNENREEYVSLYVEYILRTSVMTQFQAFYRGFTKVCGGAALDLFTTSELELLICGNPVLDFAALQSGTRSGNPVDLSYIPPPPI